MTSIAIWAGVDSRGPTSLNIASDSRISWGTTSKWDQGRKIFATKDTAHLFGYCGGVLFPALVLPVIVDLVDRGLIDGQPTSVEQELKNRMDHYPELPRFTVFHIYRVGEGMSCEFRLSIIEYTSGKWTSKTPSIPKSSALILTDGSGKQSIEKANRMWQKSNSSETSRAVFSAFCEALRNGEDPKSGGPPQLGVLYRSGPARLMGVVMDNEYYFAGSKATQINSDVDIEWRNELFERYDGFTKELIEGAQRHAPRSQ